MRGSLRVDDANVPSTSGPQILAPQAAPSHPNSKHRWDDHRFALSLFFFFHGVTEFSSNFHSHNSPLLGKIWNFWSNSKKSFSFRLALADFCQILMNLWIQPYNITTIMYWINVILWLVYLFPCNFFQINLNFLISFTDARFIYYLGSVGWICKKPQSYNFQSVGLYSMDFYCVYCSNFCLLITDYSTT